MGNLLNAVFWKCGTDQLENPEDCQSFFKFKAKDIHGQVVDFSTLRGKKAILIVNVASKCRLTFQNYKALTKMHNEHKQRGFQVLAFPCNQFFNQESSSHQQILKFVRHKFGTKFTLFEKVEVNGQNTHPVYRYLRKHSQLYDQKTKMARQIPWNFCKFLLNEQGQVVRYFDPNEDLEEIRAAVEEML